jgi:hypothetical protein
MAALLLCVLVFFFAHFGFWGFNGDSCISGVINREYYFYLLLSYKMGMFKLSAN